MQMLRMLNTSSFDHHNKAYQALLTTQANLACDITAASDSDINETTRYFHGFGKDSRWWLTNDVEIVIPEGVRRIGSQAFAGFVPVRSLSLPSTLEKIGRECFVDCIRLESVSLPPSVGTVPPAAFQGCLVLRSASAPGARTVASFAFAQCPDLADVQIPQTASVDFWAFRDSPNAKFAEPERQ